jgi:hypothetical protein
MKNETLSKEIEGLQKAKNYWGLTACIAIGLYFITFTILGPSKIMEYAIAEDNTKLTMMVAIILIGGISAFMAKTKDKKLTSLKNKL